MHEAEAEGDVLRRDRLRELEDVLKAIAADYDRASTDDGRREFGREQLAAITLHLQREGIAADVLRPATAVMSGLVDLDRGCVPSIFRKRRKASAPPVPHDHLRQRGLAAAAVTLFMRADDAQGHDDQKLDRALRKVAASVKGWAAARRWAENPRSQSLAEAIKDWREKARGGRRSEDPDASIYASVLQLADNGAPPAGLAEWVLTEVWKLYR